MHENQHNFWSLGTRLYFLIDLQNKNKYNDEIERNYFDQEETLPYESIKKENTNISYTNVATTIKSCMTTNITCVLGPTDHLIISILFENKNNGDIERNYFPQEETLTYKSIQKKNTNMSYTHEATTIKPCMKTNITFDLGITDHLIIYLHNKKIYNGEI